jgi:hypothetical protein
MQALFGFLAGLVVCALIWIDGERAERNYRIQRARRRDHAKVPSIREAVAARFDRFQDRLFDHWVGPL